MLTCHQGGFLFVSLLDLWFTSPPFATWTTANRGGRRSTASFIIAARLQLTAHTVASRSPAERIMCNPGEAARIWRTADDKPPIVCGVIAVVWSQPTGRADVYKAALTQTECNQHLTAAGFSQQIWARTSKEGKERERESWFFFSSVFSPQKPPIPPCPFDYWRMFSSDLLSAVIRTSPLVIGRHPFLIYGGQVGPHALLPVEGPSWMANHTAGHVPFSWPFNKWRRFLLQFNRLRKLTLLFLLLWEGQPGVWKKEEVIYSRNCLHLVFQPGDAEQEDPPLFLPGNKTVCCDHYYN